VSILEGLLEKRASTGAATALSNPNSFLYNWFSGGASDAASGMAVSETTALNIAAVYSAVNVSARTISSLPLKVYKSLEPRGKDEARDHPLYPILKTTPNGDVTSAAWRRTMQGDVLLWGNGYSEIERDGGARAIGLHRRHPSRVTPERVAGKLVYRVTNHNKPDSSVAAADMLHIPNFSTDGIKGLSPIQAHREGLGLALAAERTAGAFFGNGTFFGGFIKAPGNMSPEARERLRLSLEALHKGPDRAHKFAVLDEGMDYQSSGVPPEDAQLLAVRLFQVSEVARLYNLPPHKLGDLENATYSNIEEQSLAFAQDHVVPWLVVWEQELQRKLFGGTEYFAEHVTHGLLRGDFATRSEGYVKMILNGIMTRNEVRNLENLNPAEGGDQYIVPQNVALLDDDGVPVPVSGPSMPPPIAGEVRSMDVEFRANRSLEDRWRIQETFRQLIEDALHRVVARERNAIKRQLKKMPEQGRPGFTEWVVEFYADHREFVSRALTPVLLALLREVSAVAIAEAGAEAGEIEQRLGEFTDGYTEAATTRYVKTQENQLVALVREAESEEEAAALVEERLTGWQDTTASKTALKEATQATSAISRAVYALAGVTVIQWVANRGACPICTKMHGRTVEVSGAFLRKGETVDPEDEQTAPLQTKQIIQHPPLHRGCKCGVSPK